MSPLLFEISSKDDSLWKSHEMIKIYLKNILYKIKDIFSFSHINLNTLFLEEFLEFKKITDSMSFKKPLS